MKKLFTLFIVLSFYQAFSCSDVPYSFCSRAQFSPNQNIIRGKIIDSIPNGIRLKVISVLRGSETRDTVTIWNASDFICMDTTRMSASLLGDIGDTIIGILPMVDSVREQWQVVGDYVCPPDPWALTERILKIENDTVKGFISGHEFAPPPYNVLEMNYSDFISYWNSHGSTCHTLSVGISEEKDNQLMISPNLSFTSFTLQLSSPPTAQTYFQLYDALGRQVKHEEITSTITTIHRDNLPGGIYFWQLQAGNKILDSGKLVME